MPSLSASQLQSHPVQFNLAIRPGSVCTFDIMLCCIHAFEIMNNNFTKNNIRHGLRSVVGQLFLYVRVCLCMRVCVHYTDTT